MRRELICLALGALASVAVESVLSLAHQYAQVTGRSSPVSPGQLQSVVLDMGGPIMAVRLHISVAARDKTSLLPTISVSHPRYDERTDPPGTDYVLSREDMDFLDTVLTVADFDDLSARYGGKQEACMVTDAGYALVSVRRAGSSRTLVDDGQASCPGADPADAYRIHLLTSALLQLSRRQSAGG